MKSYFVLSHIYEDYVRLTLNQVVTSRSSMEQKGVVLQDRVIPISNIYDSLRLNIWNNNTKNNALIQLCNFYKDYSPWKAKSFSQIILRGIYQIT